MEIFCVEHASDFLGLKTFHIPHKSLILIIQDTKPKKETAQTCSLNIIKVFIHQLMQNCLKNYFKIYIKTTVLMFILM